MPWLMTKVHERWAICKVPANAFVRSWECMWGSLEKAIHHAVRFDDGKGIPIYLHDPSENSDGPAWVIRAARTEDW